VNSNTIRGIGSDDKTYGYGSRFTSANFGLQIPIFYAASKARIAASKINQELALNQTQIAKQSLDAQRKTAQLRYENSLQKQDYYSNKGQKLAAEIEKGVIRNLEAGMIDYANWLPMIAPAIATRNEAIMAYYQLLLAIIELNTLNNE
jgi:cobalt-zinc-cadmium resistance protein CzcA